MRESAAIAAVFLWAEFDKIGYWGYDNLVQSLCFSLDDEMIQTYLLSVARCLFLVADLCYNTHVERLR